MQKQLCKNCGGEIRFDPSVQKMKCLQCGEEAEFEQELSLKKHKMADYAKNLRVSEKPQSSENTMMECSSCGAVVEIDGHVTSAECPYCDAKIVLAEKAVETLPPDGLRPFGIQKQAVTNIFKKWVSKRWFAPNALKRMHQRGTVRGMYLPYWVFDSTASCDYTAEGGIDRKEYYTDSDGESQSRTVTDWYTIRGSITHGFKNRLMRASKSLKDDLLRKLGGFNLTETVAFKPSYLSGYSSEVFQIDMPTAYEEAKTEMLRDLEKLIVEKERRRYDRVRSVSMNVDWSKEYYRLIMLPVYSMPYSFKGKTYQVLINGETGEVVGDHPYSPIKVTLAVIAGLLIVAGIAWLYFSN